MIRKVTVEDAASICEIYNYYILHTAISFEVEAVDTAEMTKRIEKITATDYPFYVYETAGTVIGYCYLNAWKDRCAYHTTVEVSIYIDNNQRHRGIGKLLMAHLLDNADKKRFHAIVAGITLPNEASVALHEQFGFHQISHFREIGYKFNQWQDVGHWQLFLEDQTKVLILCTGNSCRSQMAHGFLQQIAPGIIVRSAGTQAAGKLNEGAVKAMAEVGIDLSHHTSDPVEKYLNEAWDYVITVCGGANESCPTFTGEVKHRLHIGFDDPSHATGAPEFIEGEFRRVRDEIKQAMSTFYQSEVLASRHRKESF